MFKSSNITIKMMLAASIACLSSTVVIADNLSHQQEYEVALGIALSAESRITSEMNRVLNSEVKHYDFIQFEHIELIRHARALAFPPAPVSAAARQEIEDQAAALLSSSLEMEWIIADYLRAFARVSSATSNIIDIATSLEGNQNSSMANELRSLKERTQQLIGSGYEDNWESVNASLSQIIESNISAKEKAELSFQQEQLRLVLPVLKDQIRKVESSATDEIAKRLEQAYRSKAV